LQARPALGSGKGRTLYRIEKRVCRPGRSGRLRVGIAHDSAPSPWGVAFLLLVLSGAEPIKSAISVLAAHQDGACLPHPSLSGHVRGARWESCGPEEFPARDEPRGPVVDREERSCGRGEQEITPHEVRWRLVVWRNSRKGSDGRPSPSLMWCGEMGS